jgi:hypothetical protein
MQLAGLESATFSVRLSLVLDDAPDGIAGAGGETNASAR